MASKGVFTILSNTPLTDSVWEMRLAGDTSAISRPGQFVNIELEGLYLRRPISISDWEEGALTIIYKVVGEGTARLATLQSGATLDLLVGLGNGFWSVPAERVVLVGGGVGVPPLYGLARQLIAEGKSVSVVLGFNTASEIFLSQKFEALGARVVVATMDGSEGVRGTVIDAIGAEGVEYDYFYSCGPLPMLRALCEQSSGEGQVSLEERMGCGFGICMGCTHETHSGHKRLCKEGPVLLKSDVIW
ncbi:MAG: dihydroorotate dehydrogenase electron transfer subunit [Tidjanibacter sp.]|nr:dihydroorotate dehydrogenase electron transfer subunit [Tidjanibacter sp.]